METITLGGATWKPEPPRDFALSNDIVLLAQHSLYRAFGAALAATWRAGHRPKASFRACKYDAGMFGGQVLNELVGRGIPMEEIIVAGAVAYEAVASVFVDATEVRAAEDFIGAAEGAASTD